MKKGSSKVFSFAQSLYRGRDCICYREKMETRWEVGKRGMGRTQKYEFAPADYFVLVLGSPKTCFDQPGVFSFKHFMLIKYSGFKT